jgi:chain length determinant protein tyrosine kinase EpsG
MNRKVEPRGNAVPINIPASQISRKSIGRMLMDAGKLTPANVERILSLQQELGLRFGETARRLGLIAEEDIQQVLAYQFNYPYMPAGTGKYSTELIAAYMPFSEQVEMLRAVRMQLMLRWFAKGNKALVVASVDMDASSAMLVANLGVVFSQLGEKTLIVDANLRQPCQQDIFNLKNRDGLSELLVGRVGLDAIAEVDSFRDLSVLPAGVVPPNPQELICGESFADLAGSLFSRFSVILYDVPAFSAGSDVLAIAARVGGVLLVARKEHTRLREIEEVSRQLRQSGAEILGSVLIDL